MSTVRPAPPAPAPPAPVAAPVHAAVHAAILDAACAGDVAALHALLAAHPPAAAARDASDESAFVLAAFRGHRAAAEAILAARRAAGSPVDAFEAAIADDAARLAALLDAEPALANAVRPDGWPVLHLTGFWGAPAAAALLLDRGADVHARSRNATANTALHATLAMSQDLAVARLLLERGADPDAIGGAGWRPLHVAASRGSADAVTLLLAHGATPAATDDAGATPADVARARGHPAVAEQFDGWR